MCWEEKLDILHDSLLYGIDTQNGHVKLYFKENYTSTPKKYEVELSEVKDLVVDNFRQGNIVLDIKILSVDQVDMADLIHLSYANEKNINPIKESLRNEGYKIFLLCSSYGCHIACAFKTINFYEFDPVTLCKQTIL